MNRINCIIIDDEPLARKGLKEYIAEIDFLHLAGEFDSALKASEMISGGSVQLIFVDIEMPKVNGMQFIKSLPSPPPVIFTTAFPQYAPESYDLNALDYLLKPISFERFLKAVTRAREHHELRLRNRPAEGEGFFFIKADHSLVRLHFDEILFVEALQNYVAIHATTKKLVTYLTFKSVEEYLPPSAFIRTHKSYIVALSKIDQVEGNEIRIGNRHIPISRNEKEEVMKQILNGRFLKR